MSLTKSVLASHIKDLECRASEMAVKYSKALQYGLCSSDCLYKKLFIANKSIDILKRFYREGKECTECTIVGNTYYVTNICTSDPNGIYPDVPNAETCYTTYLAGTFGGELAGVSITFNEDNTISLIRSTGEVETPFAYTYADSELVANWGIGNITYTVTFSDDCSLITIEGEHPTNAATLYVEATSSAVLSNTCDWKEFCLTEEEVEDLISQTREILGAKCSCN